MGGGLGNREGGGVDMGEALQRMFRGGDPSTIAYGNQGFGGNTRLGAVDIPMPSGGWDFGERFSQAAGGWGGFGNNPSTGIGAFGPTQIPTNWTNYPGVGLVPYAVPLMGQDYSGYGTGGLPQKKES